MKRKRFTKVLFGLLLMVVVFTIVAIGIIGLSGVRKMNQNVQSLYHDGLLPLNQLTQIRFTYVNSVLAATEALKNNAIPPAEARKKLISAQRTIDSNWAVYLKTHLTEQEAKLVHQTDAKKRVADSTISDLIQKLDPTVYRNSESVIFNNIQKAVNSVIVKMYELNQIQINISNNSQQQNEHLNKTIELKFYLLIAISVLFITILGYFILDDFRKYIHALRLSNHMVKESEEKYRYLFQNNPAHIMIWDLETLRILEINDSVIAAYGYTKEEWGKMLVLDYRPEKDHLAIKDFAKSLLIENRTISKSVWTHLKKNGDEMFMEIVPHKIVYQGKQAILSVAIDVTAQVKANVALNKTEEKFRLLIDHAADAIIIGSPIITDVNKSACELLQYSKEELLGMSILDLYPKEEHKSFPSIWDELQKGNAIKDEIYLLRKDGTKILVEINRKMLPDKSEAIGIIRDITERKRMETALKESEERHRALIENINDGIELLKADGSLIYQSPAVEKMVGWSLNNRIGHKVLDYVHPDDINICKELFYYSDLQPGKAVKSIYKVLHKEGHYLWLELFMTNLLENENIQAYVVTYRDITERKAFEEQQRLMSSIVNSTDDAIISITLDGKFTSWNSGAEKILGYKAIDVLGKHISIIVPPTLLEDVNDILIRISNGESIDHYETKRIKKGGELIDASLTLSPIIDSSGRVIGASKILRDITKEKQSEQQIALQNKELLKTNGELDRFVYSISHELRMPLTSIMGLYGLIDKNSLTDRDKGLMELIRKSVNNMDIVLREILDYSRNNRMDNSLEMIDIKTVIEGTFDSAQYYLESMTLDKRITINKQAEFYSDLMRVKIIINNLVSNAIKYSKVGMPNAYIDIKVEIDKEKFYLEIADNGIGISADCLPNIFKMFYRATSSVTGSGLGLYIVKESVEKIGGNIQVNSELGIGTKFLVAIPNGKADI